MHTKICSATTIGVRGHAIDVEVDVSPGMLQFHIVGLPDTAIKESRQRIVTALKNSGIRLPEKKITVNLAPADVKKEGTLFDVPIALGILHAAGYADLSQELRNTTVFLGELSLDGHVKPSKGCLPITYDAAKAGKAAIVVPEANAHEAALIDGINVFKAGTLRDIIAHVKGETRLAAASADTSANYTRPAYPDFADVKGQHQAKRALQIAAAGHHNVLFIGSPGSGKSMLARRLASIMPPMTHEEFLQTNTIYSVRGDLIGSGHQRYERPVRAPHHTISCAGLVGGGTFPQPGEISLAHNGILFLDEIVEFNRSALEILRQPLEERRVAISRAQQSVSFPASFLLVAALNPCPCGYYADPQRECVCSLPRIRAYLNKLSGPLRDRIDIQTAVQPLDYATLKQSSGSHTSSKELYGAIENALALQHERFDSSTHRNSLMSAHDVEQHCVCTHHAEQTLQALFTRLKMSMRGYHKLLKVARTLADMERCRYIEDRHVKEATTYRSLERMFAA